MKWLWAYSLANVTLIIFSSLLFDANGLVATSLDEAWRVFSRAAAKYRMKHGKAPVLIIDNANKISKMQLQRIQDFAKNASDDGTATVVFVTSEGSVPRLMRGILLFNLNANCIQKEARGQDMEPSLKFLT